MCNFEDCSNKPWKNGFCYRKHRKLAEAAPVEAPVAVPVEAEPIAMAKIVSGPLERSAVASVVESIIDSVVESFVCKSIISRQTIMSPNKNVESPAECVYITGDNSEKQNISTSTSVATEGLFERIFDLKKGGPCVSSLKSVEGTFNEKFDHDKLAFIINNLDAIKKLYRPDARNELSLDKYYLKSKTGNAGIGSLRVKYFQNGKDSIYGRYQALGSLSGQNMVREVRHTIFDEYYVDLDMDNCHPVITVWLCNKLNIPCEFITDYVANREERFRELIEANLGRDREFMKKLFLSINYGGKCEYEKVRTKTDFLISYFNEAASIKTAICKAFPTFKAASDKLRKSQKKNYNMEGAAMSHVCGFVENQLLMIIVDFLKEKVGDVSDSILCFDGIMIRKEKFDDAYLADLERIFADLGIDMKLSLKPMKPIDLTLFGYDSSETYTYGDESGDEDEFRAFNEYEIDEEALEEANVKTRSSTICQEILQLLKLLPKELIRSDEMISSYDIVSRDEFTLREIALLIKKVFAYIHNDGNYFIIAKTAETIQFKDGNVAVVKYINCGGEQSAAFKQVDFNVRVGSGLFNINLKKCLGICSKGLMYRNVDVIPHSPLENPAASSTFNLFGKYQHRYDPDFEIDQDLVGLWTNHIREVLAAGNPEVGEYLLNWFAHLLQQPGSKTGTVPLIKGRPGCGKNLAINVFQRYVMNPSLSITCPDMDKLFSRFNSARMGKVLVVLDEAVDSCNRSMNNKMKNFITEERVHIEQKGKEIIEVSDFSNYVIITNNDFASIIEKDDRRYICLVASERRVGDHEYFDRMVSSLLNVDAGRHIFHWLLRRDISNFKARLIPKTEYKKELTTRQADSVVKWLLNMYEELVDRNDDSETDMLSKEWYVIYTEWCLKYGAKALSLTAFNSIMNTNGLVVKAKRDRNDMKKIIRPRIISRGILERCLSSYIVARPFDDEDVESDLEL